MNNLINFKKKLKKEKIGLYVLVFLIISFLAKIIPVVVSSLFYELPGVARFPMNNFFYFSLVISIIPYGETLIFQHSVIFGLKNTKFFKNKRVTIIFISAAVFGISHLPSIAKILSAFSVGIVFAFVYIDLDKIDRHPILYITLIHGLHNLVAIGLTYFFVE